MLKNKFLLSFVLTLFSVMLCVTAHAVPQNDPVELLKSVANNMINGLKENKANLKTKPQVVYDLANKYVVPYADLPAMAKSVLSPSVWNGASQEQRKKFEDEFTTTVIRTYASALSNYQDQTIQFYPVRGDYQNAKTVEVSSEINSSHGDPIHVSYRLMHVGSVWRLYDLSVEGVDMLDSFREQFADIIAQGDMNLLIQRMAEHNSGRNNS